MPDRTRTHTVSLDWNKSETHFTLYTIMYFNTILKIKCLTCMSLLSSSACATFWNICAKTTQLGKSSVVMSERALNGTLSSCLQPGVDSALWYHFDSHPLPNIWKIQKSLTAAESCKHRAKYSLSSFCGFQILFRASYFESHQVGSKTRNLDQCDKEPPAGQTGFVSGTRLNFLSAWTFWNTL